MWAKILAFGTMLTIQGLAQEPQTTTDTPLTARQLFFRERSAQDNLPPLPAQKKPQASVPVKKPSVAPAPKPLAVASTVSPSNKPVPIQTAQPVPVTSRIGLRYRLLLVDKNTNKAEPANTDSTFHSGDCLALELEPNRAGYLYVLAKESNGNWHPLFPNNEMEDETELVAGHTRHRAPENYCFELDEEVGEEHLYVVLSRSAEQVQDLHVALLKKAPEKQAPPAAATTMADADTLNKQADALLTELGSRGFKVTKTDNSAAVEEKYSVFVVPAELQNKDTVFTEIRIKHQ